MPPIRTARDPAWISGVGRPRLRVQATIGVQGSWSPAGVAAPPDDGQPQKVIQTAAVDADRHHL